MQTAINSKLRAELERLGKNVDEMVPEKGTLTRSLEDAKARLDDLRKAQAAAEARAAEIDDRFQTRSQREEPEHPPDGLRPHRLQNLSKNSVDSRGLSGTPEGSRSTRNPKEVRTLATKDE